MSFRRLVAMAVAVAVGLAAAPGAVNMAAAQTVSGTAGPTLPANERQVYLVRLDQSDCTNSNVPNEDAPNVGGILLLSRGENGTTTVKVAMTVSPHTTYQFFLKCVRQLGEIRTGEEGAGFATFTFPTDSVGGSYAFDMYPEGAPAGNKFQSATVKY